MDVPRDPPGQLVDPADVIQKPITGDALYMVLAPVGPSGIAIVGDVDQFVTMGKKRVTGFTDRGAVRHLDSQHAEIRRTRR